MTSVKEFKSEIQAEMKRYDEVEILVRFNGEWFHVLDAAWLWRDGYEFYRAIENVDVLNNWRSWNDYPDNEAFGDVHFKTIDGDDEVFHAYITTKLGDELIGFEATPCMVWK